MARVTIIVEHGMLGDVTISGDVNTREQTIADNPRDFLLAHLDEVVERVKSAYGAFPECGDGK